MASKKTKKRAPSRPRRTAIVPRVVFQTVVAAAVVPVMSLAAAGCGQATNPGVDSGGFSVAAPLDAGRDAGFSVVADGGFGVADVGFSVVADGSFGVADGGFSVAAPLDGGQDSGFFSVVAFPPDGAFSVLVAPFDAGNSQS